MPDRVLVNCGGRNFHTTRTTLASSGAQYFQALLGPTGAALGAKRRRRTSGGPDADADGGEPPLFLDRDPDLFADVLFFMRSTGLPPKTRLDPVRLEALAAEADFFVYDGLKSACLRSAGILRDALRKSLRRRPEPKAWQGFLSISSEYGSAESHIRLKKGQIVYIVSATLTGRCFVRRYEQNEGEKKRDEGAGCYINTSEKHDTGDFELQATRYHETFAIAHIGLDHFQVGKRPLNYNFRQDLRLYLEGDDTIPPDNEHIVGNHAEEGDDDEESFKYVHLASHGSGQWDVVFWAGEKSAIPGQLADPSAGGSNRHLSLGETGIGGGGSDDDEDSANVVMVAVMAGMVGSLSSLAGVI